MFAHVLQVMLLLLQNKRFGFFRYIPLKLDISISMSYLHMLLHDTRQVIKAEKRKGQEIENQETSEHKSLGL